MLDANNSLAQNLNLSIILCTIVSVLQVFYPDLLPAWQDEKIPLLEINFLWRNMKSMNNKCLRILQVIVFPPYLFLSAASGKLSRKRFPCKVVCICTCCVTDRKMWEWDGALSHHCWDYIYFCFSSVAGSLLTCFNCTQRAWIMCEFYKKINKIE